MQEGNNSVIRCCRELNFVNTQGSGSKAETHSLIPLALRAPSPLLIANPSALRNRHLTRFLQVMGDVNSRKVHRADTIK